MPDRYDRAVCATELRIRDDILGRVRAGWVPAAAFELPKKPKAEPAQDARSSGKSSVGASTSETSLSRYAEEERERRANNIADLDESPKK